MRRWARRTGLALLALLLIVIAAAFATARHADPALWPPRAGEPAVQAFVVSNGYHTGIALPRAALADVAGARGLAALIAVAQRFNQYQWLEIGWGDENFYRHVPTIGDLTLPRALRALFQPGNRSVLHVVGVTGDLARVFPVADVIAVPLSRAGFERLLRKLDATFSAPQDGALPDAGPGLYGPSLFYPATGTFSIWHVCNHWIGDLLDAAGLPTTPVVDTFATGLLLDLRWRAGLRPVFTF
jgi:uncharacterized protein (TIGR02117 family)